MKKGKKKEENYIKKWEKGLKNASFWAINSPAANLFFGERNLTSKEGDGGIIRIHNIYPCIFICLFESRLFLIPL